MKIKQCKKVAERDKLFKEYMELGKRIDEINDKIYFKVNKDIEAKIWKNGVLIRNSYKEVLIPFEVFEKIIEWFKELMSNEEV